MKKDMGNKEFAAMLDRMSERAKIRVLKRALADDPMLTRLERRTAFALSLRVARARGQARRQQA